MTFKINYKGTSCRGTEFLYVCACANEQKSTHPAAEEPSVTCTSCGGIMKKKLTVTSLDADHHDSMRFHNLGWSENDG